MKKTIQKIQKAVGVTPDGVFGSLTLHAVADKLCCKPIARSVQHAVGAAEDGVLGKDSLRRIACMLGFEYPTQSEVRSGKSIFGKAGDESNLVSIKPAYQLYFEGKKIGSVRVHKLIAKHVEAVFREVADAYTADEIHTLGLDQYSGSFNFRSTRSGQSMSMHAWGIALDFSAETNSYSTKKPSASLSKPECDKWWEIWEAHGAVSLGRQKDYDWMHVQFASL